MLSAASRGKRGPTIIITDRLDTEAKLPRRTFAPVVIPLIIFGLSRLYGWFLLAQASPQQIALPEQHQPIFIYEAMPADPGYLGLITNWDGQWYESIATDGYQVPSADDPDRARLLWSWAFPPLYPFTVRAVMFLTQTPFAVAATVVSLTAGAIAMVLLYRLLSASGGQFLAVAGVALSSSFISAPLFQVAYSESLSLMLLMAFLLLLRGRRYLWALAAVAALSMTRIITLPLAVVVAVHAWTRFRSGGRSRPSRSEKASLALLGAGCVAGVLSWLMVASVFLGPREGLARTENQRNLYLGWFTDAVRYWGPAALFFVILLVVVIVLYAASRFSRGWSPELRAWGGAYPLYIFAISPIMPGTLRYLLLAPTLPLMLVGSPARATWPRALLLAVVCGLSLWGQAWFVNDLFVISTLTPRFAP